MTMNERPTVVGVFATRLQAESAINELHRFGITDQQIGFVVRDASGNTQGNVTPDETHTAHNAIGGAVSGGVLGGLIGAATSLLIPGFGPAIAGGILGSNAGRSSYWCSRWWFDRGSYEDGRTRGGSLLLSKRVRGWPFYCYCQCS